MCSDITSLQLEQSLGWREKWGDGRWDQRRDKWHCRCEKDFELYPLDLLFLTGLSFSHLFVHWISGGTWEKWTCIHIYGRSFLSTVWVELHPALIIQRWQSSLVFRGHVFSLAQLNISLGYLATHIPSPSFHHHLNSVFCVTDVTATVLALVNQ